MILSRTLLVLGAVIPVFGQYAGPAILSRGEAPGGPRGAPITFRPFLQIEGSYDTGLAGVGVADSQGNLANSASEGVEVTGGVSGYHRWAHTSLGLDYRGSLRHYANRSYYDGTDQSVSLGFSHQVSRRLYFGLRESAGLFSRDFGIIGLQAAIPFDPAVSYIPRTDFFDNRTVYLSSQADLTYQKSARLSFALGGDYFTTHRRSSALYGVTGQSARSDIQYRTGKNSSLGLDYTFTRYSFSKAFGDSYLHTAVGTYSVRFTKFVEASVYGGVTSLESKFIQVIRVDPVVAAIIGQGSATSVIHRNDLATTFGGRISRSFRTGVLSGTVTRGVTPGNGLFLTSVSTFVSGSYQYTGLRKWSSSVSFTYSRAEAISNVSGHYGSYDGTFYLGRRITRFAHLVASFSARQYDSHDFSRYNRLIYSARIGLGFAPGAIPLRAW